MSDDIETETDYASVDDLIADADAEDGAEDFTLRSGRKVRVRGLTRAEHLWISKGTDDAVEIEARLLAKALIKPAMTLEQAKAWQKKAGSATVSEISDRIRDLSGYGKGAQKSAV
jgi:hypothetical protein